MEENFELLLDRVIDTLEKSDLVAIKEQLDEIKGNTILVGSGGSSVVAEFASKVLGVDNVKSSRDLNYMNLNSIDNAIVFSYSGKGYTTYNLLDKGINIYQFTNSDNIIEGVTKIKYDSSIKNEKSFISLASTLMPIAILYSYYTNLRLPHLESILVDMFNKAKDVNIHHNNVYEILSGYDTKTAAKYLESTLTESGIAIPIVHDKYDYCHGRSTLSYKNNHGLIILDSEKELDKLYLEVLKDYYTEIVRIEKYYSVDTLDNDLYATIKSMYLTKMLAENNNVDLSKIDYSPVVKKLYYYNGKM